VDGQPYSKAGLPKLTDLDLQQQEPKDLIIEYRGGVNVRQKNSEESREMDKGSEGGSL